MVVTLREDIMLMAVMNTCSEPCAKLGTFTYIPPNPHNCFKKKQIIFKFGRW